MDFELSDSDSHSESSSSEDQDDLESIYGGQARNIFSRLDEIIENIDDLLFFEPQLNYGDIVYLISDTSGKMGKVINVDMVVDLENTNGSKIHNINAKFLEKIRSFSVGDVVVCGVWLGRVERIVADSLTIQFDCGRKSQLSTAGPKKIVPISPDIVDDPRYPFYPGQRVQVESSVSNSTHWLCGSRRAKRDFGTVCNINTGLLYVEWLDCVSVKGEKQPAPFNLQDPKNLSLLSCFSPTNWQLGEWGVLPNEQNFPSVDMSNLVQEDKKSGVDLNVQEIAAIVKMKTKVDVLWQDGSLSRELETHLLRSVSVLDIHDFWPDTIVLEKETANNLQDSGIHTWGIVRCADSKERTVKVKWCNSGVKGQFDEKPVEETVSVYELVEHPYYSYSLGDIVYRKDECEGVDLVNKTTSKICMDEASNLENCRDGAEHLLNDGLSYIGIVTGSKNGNVEVKWASGVTTEVAPYEIYQADKCDGTTSTSLQTSENLQHSNEGTQAKDSQLLEEKILLGLDCDNLKESASQFLPQAATKFFTNLFRSLSTVFVDAHQCMYEDEPSLGKPVDEKTLELCNLNSGGQTTQIDDDSETHEEVTSDKCKEVNKESFFLSCSLQPGRFSQFNMVSGCSDHHFANGSGTGQQYFQMNRGWLKKVTQEWSILEENLPETIYVRAYEDKMELLRAAIVGSAGTPYHDGLFVFDIYLPPHYPNDPPMVHYHSGGLRINPNLYESGKICLSLLNTWAGSNTEVWNPESSTILQLLLSLQALVLNDKPYFNEAGYDSQVGKPEGEKNSINYNENTFLVSCSSMLYLLRNPPEHFEELVKEHFSRRCSKILLACKAYMDGATIGYPFSGSVTAQENQTGNSTGFKIMLGKLYPKLVEAFSSISGECDKMPDQVP